MIPDTPSGVSTLGFDGGSQASVGTGVTGGSQVTAAAIFETAEYLLIYANLLPELGQQLYNHMSWPYTDPINVSSFASVWKTAHALTETSKKSTDLKEIIATQSTLKLSCQSTANCFNQRKRECIRQIEQLKEENAVYIIRVLELEKQVDSLMWVWPNDPTPTMGKIILTGELCVLCTHDVAWHKSGGKCQNACHCPGFGSDGYIGAWDNDPTAQELEY